MLRKRTAVLVVLQLQRLLGLVRRVGAHFAVRMRADDLLVVVHQHAVVEAP